MNHKDNLSLFVGRFNPLTTYHMGIIQQMQGHKVIVATKTYGIKDPIHVASKMMMLNAAIVKKPRTSMDLLEARDIMEALTLAGHAAAKLELSNEIILHCGTDRAVTYQRLNRYTEETGVVINRIVVHDRLDDTHSATHLRSLAVAGQWNEFQKLCGYATTQHKSMAYNMIRMHHGSLQGQTISPAIKHISRI